MDTRFIGAEEGPFLVLSDSTLQHLLFTSGRGKSYGVEPVMGGYAIVSPGATLVVLEASSQSTTSFPVQHPGSYNWIAGVRDDYGLGSFELQEQTIMSLQARQDEWPTPPYLVDQLYKQNNCHFRPEVAEKAIGLLVGRALKTMRRQQPGKFQVLVICSWNSTDDKCSPGDARRGGALPGYHSLGVGVIGRQGFRRQFFNDGDLENVVRNHAGSIGLNLIQRLTQPQHYNQGGFYMDIKLCFTVTFDQLRAYVAADWQAEQQDECRKFGLPESPPFQPPSEYLLMGIGQRGDHIFQGIIYGQPKHPLLLQAIKHSFSRRILSC
ncbi:unnamed protein product, partial [Symbiodinium sp. CCMP2456]